MEQWEYLTTFLDADTRGYARELQVMFPTVGKLSDFAPIALMPKLNEYGAKGWELITCHPYTVGENLDVMTHTTTGAKTWIGQQYTHTYFCVFKRQKQTS
jgi:hypothetical protein